MWPDLREPGAGRVANGIDDGRRDAVHGDFGYGLHAEGMGWLVGLNEGNLQSRHSVRCKDVVVGEVPLEQAPQGVMGHFLAQRITERLCHSPFNLSRRGNRIHNPSGIDHHHQPLNGDLACLLIHEHFRKLRREWRRRFGRDIRAGAHDLVLFFVME